MLPDTVLIEGGNSLHEGELPSAKCHFQLRYRSLNHEGDGTIERMA